MNKRIITASAAAFVLAFAGVLKAEFTQQKLGWEDFSLYASGDNVTNMEYTASQNNYTNTIGGKNYGLSGHWYSSEDFAEGEFSTINDGGTLTLNTGGAVVTNAFIEESLLNDILDGSITDVEGTTANGDVFIKTTVNFVPSDSLEDFSAEQGDPESDLKFAIYAYADEDVDPPTTNLVVYHAYYEFDDGVGDVVHRYVTDVLTNAEDQIDFGQPTTITVTMRKDPVALEGNHWFKITANTTAGMNDLTSDFGCTEEAMAGTAEPDGGAWFLAANGDSTGKERFTALNFKGTGEVSDIQVGFYGEGGSTPEEYEVSWTVENVVVSNTTAGVAATSGDMFEVDTVLTFYPTVGSITNINGVAQDPGLDSYAYTVSGDATLVVLAGEEPTLYEVTWTAPNVGATTNGVAVSTGSSFEAGTEITFTADTGYIITGVTGYVTDTPTNSFVYVVTSSASQSLTITASAETPSVPEWARPAGADQSVVDAYADWAAVHGKSEDLTVDHSAQFLMNVDADVANIVLSIDAIEITAEGTKITIGATGDGTPITIGTTASAVDTYAINGILNVSVASTLGSSWTKKSIPLANLEFVGGKAVVIIPAADGSFIKASVDYTAGETSIHEITP